MNLTPTFTTVYCVRYWRAGNAWSKHRMYARQHPAEEFAARLNGYGYTTAIYTTGTTEWRQVR